MQTAYEWGLKHNSCKKALEMRKNYASQAAWWKACDRGDWLIWQLLNGLTDDELQGIMPALLRAINKIVGRGVHNYALNCGIRSVEAWAQRWLDGKDRSCDSAELASKRAQLEGALAAMYAARAAFNAERAEWEAKRSAECVGGLAAVKWAMEWAVRGVRGVREMTELKHHSEIPEWPGDD